MISFNIKFRQKNLEENKDKALNERDEPILNLIDQELDKYPFNVQLM